jgi:dsRNA-specific ribonuclease
LEISDGEVCETEEAIETDEAEDPSRTAARAMRAIIGAIYYDGGLQAARRVMAELGLIIKPGE